MHIFNLMILPASQGHTKVLEIVGGGVLKVVKIFGELKFFAPQGSPGACSPNKF